MTKQTKSLLHLALILAMTACGSMAGYYYAENRFNKYLLFQLHTESASSARNDAQLLTLMRTGEDQRAIEILQNLMSIELITLNTYEKTVPKGKRSSQVYADIAEVRAYYQRFPDAKPSEYAAEALSLKRESQNVP